MAGQKKSPRRKSPAKKRATPPKQKPQRKSASGIPVHCATTRIVPIGSVTPNPRNPNQHPESQIAMLAQIIEGQGWRNPIVVSKRSGFITKGHCRLLAAQLLKVKEVPVDDQEYENDAAEFADMIADNRIAELAQLDSVMLKDLLSEIDTTDVENVMSGYSDKEIEALMTGNEDIDPEEYSELDEENDGYAGSDPGTIAIEVPEKHVDAVKEWLANGEALTGPGMGKGVLGRCGLL